MRYWLTNVVTQGQRGDKMSDDVLRLITSNTRGYDYTIRDKFSIVSRHYTVIARTKL